MHRLLLALAFSLLAGAQPSLRQQFREPAKAYRPMVRWWWPGGDVTDAELKHELRLMDEANFGGAEIQAFRIGLDRDNSPETLARVNDYLTPSFYSHVRAALEEARSRGMWIDYTLGSGWPFGGGENITPELSSKELRQEQTSLRGPMKFKGTIPMPQVPVRARNPGIDKALGISPLPPSWEERLKQSQRVVAVIAVRGHAPELNPVGHTNVLGMKTLLVSKPGTIDPRTAVVLTNQVGPGGSLEWDVPEGEWLLFTFAQNPAPLRVVGGAGAGPQLVLDHMKREAMQSHLQAVGESAKKYVGSFFGNGLRAVFCDSLEVQAFLFWSDSFLADFRRLRGYDLTPFLPLIKHPGIGEPYGSYTSPPLYDAPGLAEPHLAQSVRRDYWQTVSDLMIENFYGPLDDWAHRHHLKARVQAHGAPADILKIYGMSDIPETEHQFAGGRFDFLKYAASAAHVYGHKIVSSESFVRMGNPYRTTPEMIKVLADELVTAGVNQMVYHGFPYTYMDRPEPGWHPFSAPLPFSGHFNQHNTFWEFFKPLNAYITRLQFISQTGWNIAPIAMFKSNLAYEEGGGPESELNSKLMARGYNFDQINAAGLLLSKMEYGSLISPGGAQYEQLVLQNEKTIALPVAQKLAMLARQGFPIVYVGSVPKEEESYREHDLRSRQIRELLKDAVPVAGVDQALEVIRRHSPPDLMFATPATDILFTHRRIHNTNFYFLRNRSNSAQQVDAIFPGRGSPESWDAWTGNVQPVDDFEVSPYGMRMSIHLEPNGSQLLSFDPADRRAPRPVTQSTAKQLLAIDTGWTLRIADRARNLDRLVDWSSDPDLKSFSGKATYTSRFNLDATTLQQHRRINLDLGNVKDVAQIRLNGRPGPLLLFSPYRADVTNLLKPGENTLEVLVTNSLTNGLLAKGVDLSGFFVQFGQKTPVPAGLIGPVKLEAR